MQLKIRTLTPLWTGDVDGNCTKIKETGIIGSLRWWYEALVRGLGGYACDPTNSNCQFNYKAYTETGNIEDGFTWEDHPERNVCDVCKLFGCTGWRKKFKIEIGEVSTIDLFFVTSSNKRWLEILYENLNTSLYDETTLKVIGFEDGIDNVVLATLWFAKEYGGVGAKTQNGFGQIDLENLTYEDVKKGFKKIKEIKEITEEKAQEIENPLWPSISDFFVLKFKVDGHDPAVQYYLNNPFFTPFNKNRTSQWKDYLKNNFIPCSFDIRYRGKIQNKEFGLREHFKNAYGENLIEDIFGFSNGNNKQGSRVHVSHLYKEDKEDDFYYLKVWGFVPEKILERYKEINSIEDFKLKMKEHIRNQVFDKDKVETKISKTGNEIMGEIL